jgi:peptidoglycan/LPS O-acetylase OafA/YrhL
MAASKGSSSSRLVWLEGIRIFAAVMILLYHAQLLITDYAFTPQPTGLADNLHHLALAGDRLGQLPIMSLFSIPAWFGFQFVDVFILISGFALTLSLRDRSLEPLQFFKRRFLRILLPFWTVAWLAYPILWAIGSATHSYIPDPWHIFAGSTFPLLFQFDGELLLPTSGPWWFVPLILSFTLVSPLLWKLLHRWGARNLLIVSILLTLSYRALATYPFGGHPTYVILDTPTGWLPFVPFIAKLSTFVLGMVVGHAYCLGRGPVFWSASRSLLWGGAIYAVGFVCQFYRLGWVVADLLLPVGLGLCCMVLFRALSMFRWASPTMVWLGLHSYSYFLVHNFVVDRTINLVVDHKLSLYYLLLPVMVVGTLILAVLADSTTPLIKRFIAAVAQDVDYVLTIVPNSQIRVWHPQVGDRVRYHGNGGWLVMKVEQLLDDKEVYLCQVSDGQRTMWLNEDDLELDSNSRCAERNGHCQANSHPFKSY